MDLRVQLPPAQNTRSAICGFVKTLYKNESKPDLKGSSDSHRDEWVEVTAAAVKSDGGVQNTAFWINAGHKGLRLTGNDKTRFMEIVATI